MDGPKMSSFTFRELPRDDDGIIIGMWRVRHKTSAFEGGLGGAVSVNFVKGIADRPMGGGDLHRLMCAMGAELTCVPWEGDVPKPTPDTTRRNRGFGPASAEAQMSIQERDELRSDRARKLATDAVERSEQRSKFAGLPPRPRPEVSSPTAANPQIAKSAPAEDAPTVVEAPVLNDNQRAVMEMLEDAGQDVDSLRELAEEVGIKVDRRWAAGRLRTEIQAAAQNADTIAPPSEGADELDGIEDMDVLRSIAEGLGVDADEFDSADSLRTEIRRAQADVDKV